MSKTRKEKFLEMKQNRPYLSWSILSAYRGSIAHDMYIPNTDPNSIDDVDIMSVIIPPIEYYFGLKEFGSRGTKEVFQDEWDIVCYELLKFISLLAKGNPNVLSLLWVDTKHILELNECGQLLREKRDIFATKQVYHSFYGYAYGQLKRMTACKHKGYMGQKRKALVDKYGYDCKNAAHLIRLLRMGCEFLNEGFLYVSRRDNNDLLSIKRGEWNLEKVKAEADLLFKRIENTYDNSKLPPKPDLQEVNRLCVEMLEIQHGYIQTNFDKQ